MEFKTVAVMVVIVGFVWGGFLFFLLKALRSEKKKKGEACSNRDGEGERSV